MAWAGDNDWGADNDWREENTWEAETRAREDDRYPDFSRGRCTRGDNCRYPHQEPVEEYSVPKPEKRSTNDNGDSWNCAVLHDHVKAIVGSKGRIISQIERGTRAKIEVSRHGSGGDDKNIVLRGEAQAKKACVRELMEIIHKLDGVGRLKLFVPREIGDAVLHKYDFDRVKWENDGVWVDGTPQDIADAAAAVFSMERPSELVSLKLAFPHKLIRKLIGTPECVLPEYRSVSCQIDTFYDQVPNSLNPVLLTGLQGEKMSALQVILEKLEDIGECPNITMVLPRVCLPAAIGTMGNNVLKLETETSCKIDFAREDQEGVVACSAKITGPSRENVLEACKLLDEIVTKEPRSRADSEFTNLEALPLYRPKPTPAKPTPTPSPAVPEEAQNEPAESRPIRKRSGWAAVHAIQKEPNHHWKKPTLPEWSLLPVDLLIDKDSLAKLWGVEGKTIHQIEDESRSKIEINRHVSYGKDTLVKVRGEQHVKKSAIEHLLWELAEVTGQPLDRATIMVPTTACATVIGPSSNVLAEIEEKSGAKIEFVKSDEPLTRVNISGELRDMVMAIIMVNDMLCLDLAEPKSSVRRCLDPAPSDLAEDGGKEEAEEEEIFPLGTFYPTHAEEDPRDEDLPARKEDHARSASRKRDEDTTRADERSSKRRREEDVDGEAKETAQVYEKSRGSGGESGGGAWGERSEKEGADWDAWGGYGGAGWWDDWGGYGGGWEGKNGWWESSRKGGNGKDWDGGKRWKRAETEEKGGKGWRDEKGAKGGKGSGKDGKKGDTPASKRGKDDLVLLLDPNFTEAVDMELLRAAVDIDVEASEIHGCPALTLCGAKDRIMEGMRELCQMLEQLGHLPNLTVFLQPWLLGGIIGPKGANVMEAQRTSGCRIDVSRSYSTLTVSGDYMEQVAFGIEHALSLK
eukprot:GEMP01006160.1.p1 GENE.GEMP01006160.1~~GEMP01006160.1.p1  ORF type:complete len:915 (+),score=220.89 GEMP01006160.1:53-2797(+)